MRNDVSGQVMTKLIDNSFEDQIIDIMLEMAGTENLVSDIPISPNLVQDSGEVVLLEPTIYEEYQSLIEKANSGLPVEIPFILLGNYQEIDGKNQIVFEELRLGYTNEEELEETSVQLDPDIFEKSLNIGYSVVSIGHTHPNVSEDTKRGTLTNNLPSEFKEKHQIRDVGLNLSIADFHQHEGWKGYAKAKGFDGKILQTIIMYNGDMIIIGDETISKSNNVSGRTAAGEVFPISTGSSNSKEGKQL